MPSYNQAQFLEKTILSILNQNYPNTEIIVMDGGSQDGSVDLIKRYEPYISYWVSELDKGQPNAINKGFERASGDLIGWQNSDDLYLPGFFHTIADTFHSYPKTQLFIANIYTIDENDRITWASHFIPFSVADLIYRGWNLSSQATFLSQRIVREVGLMREDIQVGFDWDWFIRVGKVVKYVALHKAYGGCYRIHEASKLSTQPHESRWSIERPILQSLGIRIREELPYDQQPWWQRRMLKIRMLSYLALLYFSPNNGNLIQGASNPQYVVIKRFLSKSYPILRCLRPLILWYLAKRSIICRGFA
ncbi:MAG: glycosyltransferase [Chloroflexi bacterium]|nr:glycosyltransferase [Chloroflexota bacterium]